MDTKHLETYLSCLQETARHVKEYGAEQSIIGLKDYAERAYQELMHFNHGENTKYFIPYDKAITALEKLIDKCKGNFDTRRCKKSLLLILNRYINSMHMAGLGLEEIQET